MDAERFDLWTRVFRTRRTALGGLIGGGLTAAAGWLNLSVTEAGKRRNKKKRKRRRKKRCRPRSPAATCAGRCGTVINNCRRAVDCGGCPAGETCGADRRCACGNGPGCPSGRSCLANGTCAIACPGGNDDCPNACGCFQSPGGVQYCADAIPPDTCASGVTCTILADCGPGQVCLEFCGGVNPSRCVAACPA